MGFKGLRRFQIPRPMVKELAKMLIEKAESGDNCSLKDIWAAYRKKEVQVEVKMNRGVSDPESETETISLDFIPPEDCSPFLTTDPCPFCHKQKRPKRARKNMLKAA